MPRHVFTNNAVTTLAAGITNSATTITLTSDSAFSSSIYDDPIQVLTITDPAGVLAPEIVYATRRPTANQRTVVRACEDTTAQAWPSGAVVSARVTAGMLQSFAQMVDGALSLSPNGPRGKNWLDQKAVQTGGFPVLQIGRSLPDVDANTMDPNVSREIVGGTLPLDLGTVSTWVSDATYYPFAVVEPTTPNGKQYCFQPNSPSQTASTTAQPAFGTDPIPALNGSTEVGTWIPIDRTDLRQSGLDTMPANSALVVTEVGFYCTDYGAGSAPVVSIGDSASATRFASAVSLSQITGYGGVHRIPISTGGATIGSSGHLKFACVTPSSGTFKGRFYWKGFMLAMG